MFLFILESIGMPELLMIGMVALIIFGPRKLPEMAKMIGKTMAEFRRATGEFRETWEKEAKFDLDKELDKEKEYNLNTTISSNKTNGNNRVLENIDDESTKFLPEIREVSADDFDKEIKVKKIRVEQKEIESEKRNWL